MKNFLENPSARILGTILTLACLASAIAARFFWENIDLTQIIMMILAPATNMISYGMGAAHSVKPVATVEGRPKEGLLS